MKTHLIVSRSGQAGRALGAVLILTLFFAATRPAEGDAFGGNSAGAGLNYSSWFGYYTTGSYPLVYEYYLGYEYAFPSGNGVYLYDYASGHFWYTQASYFPFVYDFTLNAFLYYYNANTPNRHFYNFGTGQVVSNLNPSSSGGTQLSIVAADLQLASGTIYHTDGNGHTISPVYAVNPETLLAQGGSPLSGYTWSLANLSSFPPGTTVDALTGVFHGNGSPLVTGNYTFTMTVSDGSTTASGTFSFSVTDDYNDPAASSPCEQLYLSTYALANAKVGAGYGASLYADGGTPPYKSWSLVAGPTSMLPPGLVIDAARGVVRGTPSSAGSYSFQITLTDNTGTAALNYDSLYYTITVNP